MIGVLNTREFITLLGHKPAGRLPDFGGYDGCCAHDTGPSRRASCAADRYIAELRGRISHQLEIMERRRSYGISNQDREDLLATLGESLHILQRHRELIREALQGAE